MKIKILYLFLIFCLTFSTSSYAQNINLVGPISRLGRLAVCGPDPTITVTRISGTGSQVVGGVLICDDPCDTTILELKFENLQWQKNMPEATGPQVNEDNWIHGFYFPNSATISLLPYNPPLGNLGYVFVNSCTGTCPAPAAGGTVGPAGVYFDNTSSNSCCGTNPNNDGVPQNNWGDGSKGCGVNFTFIFRARLCNNKITGSSILLRFRADSDGNTGCWTRRDDFFNSLTFSISTSPCATLYNPAPTSALPVKTCLPTLNYTATLSGGCGNGNTITWWDAPIGGNQIGSGSPFTYDPAGLACPAGNTIYAACCPPTTVCGSRQAFVIPGPCPSPLTITNVAITEPTCPTLCGEITATTVTGATGALSYTLMPENITNTTGVFTCILGANHTVTVTDAAGCVASASVVFTVPPCGSPTVTPVTYCLNAPAVPLIAATTGTGTNLQWYTTLIGGTGSTTAPTPSTAAVGATTYYVTQTISGVESTPRTPLTVTVVALPAAPTVTTPVVYCQGLPSTALTATGTNLLWYAAATGGVGSATAPTPSTATVGSTIYYVSQTVGTCESPRAAITVTINTTPAAPTVTTPVLYCQGAPTIALTATGTGLLWYTTATGGTGTATAPTPTSTTVGSTIYYVSSTVGTCEGPRAAITVTVNATPVAPTVTSPILYCQNDVAVALTATGTNLLWYTVATGGTGTATAPTPSTTTIGSTIYYVSATTGTCEGPRAAITVTITAPPAAPTVTTPVVYCQGLPSTALTATGTNLLWYAAATGGTGSATAPTPSTATVGSTIYYVSQTSGTCESPRAAITVTINTTPAAPTVTTPVVYCQGAPTVALTATGTGLLWYTTATGGTGTATAPTPTSTTVGSTVYYVSSTVGICEGPRAAITVDINATPVAPTVTSPILYCQNDVAVPLTATGTNLLWYTTATGGTGTATAPTPSTATIGSTIYYVSATTGTCEGPRAAITVTITAPPAAPTVTTPVVYCQGLPSTALTATGTNLLWYAAATGGTGSTTAPTPSTATVGSTIYYVSQTSGTCESPRAAITVTINTTPAAPTVTTPVVYCQGAPTVALTATGTGLLYYTTATGGTGTATAPTPTSTTVGSTIYYVSSTVGACEGPRAAITITINATPVAPTVTTPIDYCQNATATALTATGTNLLWYTTATGGTGSTTAPTPLTTTAGSTTYYVSQSTGICEGPRAAIVVNITAPAAAPVVVTPLTYCQNLPSLILTATGTNLLWYTTATGGTGSATAPTPSTATAGSTIYYVSQTVGGCEGPRAAITVVVNATPALPGVTSPIAYCQNDVPAILTATGTNLLWYTTATGGTGSATAPTPTTSVGGTTTYYVSQTILNCEGPRAAIVVNVTATPAAPAVTTPIGYCQNATATALTATGTNLLWYTTATGGTGSATAPTPSTTTAGSTTYYVSQSTGVCEGPRAAIVVNITAPAAAPAVVTPVTYCQNSPSLILTATGTNLLWYTTATGGTGSATAPTPSTATAGSTIYYVSQTVGGCEGPRAAITVVVNATPALPGVTSPIAYCQNDVPAILTATGTNLLWYTTATGGTGSATAPTPTTSVGGTTTYYVSQTILNCEGPRAAIVVNVTATPAAPAVTTPIGYCQNATATALTATGTNLLWYTTATGGTGSATAPTPSTTTAGSTTYYVSQSTGVCEGPRAAIVVNITAPAAAPVVVTPLTYCQNLPSLILTATGTNLLWYTTATGGTGTATAPTPSTATAGSTIYYVSQTVGGCEGPRAAITVVVNATPALPGVTSPIAYCQNDIPAILTATGTNLLWYTTATGGTGSATAPTPTTSVGGTTTYYVSQTILNCEGPRAAIVVNVTATPAAPGVTTPVVYCQGTTPVALTATGSNLLWYSTATGGTGSTTAPTASTATVGSTIYYVSQSTGVCEGPRAAITVTVNTTPAAPVVTTPVVYCQGTTAVALTATGTNLLWYTTATGGTGSVTAPTPSTISVGNTIYYVSQTTGICEGPRAAITVTINTTPLAPTATSPITYCEGATSTALTATGTNLLWYTTATGGIGSATAPIPSTVTVGSTIYYVSSTIGICEGPRRAITVTIVAIPVAPTVTTPVVYCQGVTPIALTAGGTSLLWYTTATGGIGSATAPTPSTATVGSTTYYVSQSTGACEGPRAAITVTVNITPAAPTVTSPVIYCQNTATIPLTATGTNLLWYTTATGGTGSATAPTPLSTTAGNTIYYVSQTTGICQGPRTAITVTINATPALPGVVSPIDYCQNAASTQLSAAGTSLLWYTTATGGTGSAIAPTPSTIAGGSTIYYVSQTILNCEGPRAQITINVTATPLAPTATSPITYCQGATPTVLTATGTNLLWYTIATGGTGSSTAPTPSTNATGSTIYYVSQSTGTCEGPRTAITVIVNSTPLAPITNNLIYCQNATVSPLTATGTNLLWYAAATGGVGSAAAPIPSTLTAGTTTYYVSQTTGICEGPRASMDVTITATPIAPTVISPINYCPNDPTVQLTAIGTNLLWYTSATGGVGSSTAPTPSSAAPGVLNYYVSQSTSAATGGCEGPRAQIIVNINNNNLTVNIGVDSTICEGESVKFTPLVSPTPPSIVYQWRAIGVPLNTIDSLRIKDATVKPVDNATYILSATIGGCATEDTVNVTVRWKPILDAGLNRAICLNDVTLLQGVVSHFTSNLMSFTWSPIDSLAAPGSIQTIANPTRNTWYKLTDSTTKAGYGCDFVVTDSVKVIVQPVVKAFAGNDTIAVKGVPHQLFGRGGANYTWSSPTPSAIISNPFSQKAFATLTEDANFYLKVTDAVGCAGYDSIFVKVYNGPTYYVPNSFTPNGDGLNDIFRAIPVGMSNTTYFRVFNRFGELMFETNQWLKGWDGTFKGKPQPNGAYVWIVSGTDKDNKKVEMKGTVMIIR